MAGWLGAADTTDLTLAIEPRWGRSALAVPSVAISNDSAEELRVTRFAALVGNVSLWQRDGGVVRLEGQYGFIDAASGRRSIRLSGVPPGDFVGLEFEIGVPENINHADPGQWPAGHALNPLVNGLHWSWQGGYVFLALEGRWRAKGEAATMAERGFSFHLAREPQRMAVRLRADFSIHGSTTIHLAVDLGRILGNHQLGAGEGSDSTHSAENDTVAAELARSVERAWFWLHATPTAPASGGSSNVASSASGPGRPHAFTVPAGFPQPSLPADNPLTAEGIALGAALFFEPRLSAGATQSCASCHDPARAFSDSVALSRGAEGATGTRNAMPLFNLAWSPSYAWDGSRPRIRDQALAAWTNPVEMHGNPADAVAALSADAAMTDLFRRAFGSAAITPEKITLALEQYLLVQVAADSKFDRALRGEAALTTEESHGFELFATEYDPARGRYGADCFHCHGGALFTDYALKNNGLDGVALDAGAARVSGSANDLAKFKTPSLRNVAITGPYMHDGRFSSLEEVIAHYDHDVERTSTLDPNLAKHPAAGLRLSAEDQRALVAFLRALTDERLDQRANAPSQ